MASCRKQPRLETDVKDFSECPTELIKKVLVVLEFLCSLGHTVDLIPLKFIDCNAAVYHGRSFSKADCSTDESNNTFILADIFQRGLKILLDFTDEKKVPDTCNKQEKYVLQKLLRYIKNDGQFPSEYLSGKSNTELTTLLANHLFGPLATTPHYLIDRNCAEKGREDQCLCGERACKLTGSFGDTSIGNSEVWHGNLDVIINEDVVVETVKDAPDTLREKSPVEVKLKSEDFSRNAPQIIAETIVFSFLQKKRHPERDHFLLPCIAIGNTEIVLLFYDSQDDVLLESSKIPLIDDETDEISLNAIVVAWLVVNHKYLCTGLTDDMKEYKADFFVHAEAKLQIYKEKLQLGNVVSSFKMAKRPTPQNKRRSKFVRETLKKITDTIDLYNE